jgi:hypothetical protein
MSEINYKESEYKKDEKPNEKELRLFEEEKMELYKGTFVVCIVYGISALLLLIIILFTDWGREYIYNKFAPAIITYIIGALIIIIYLLNAIFTLQPRKIGASIDNDNNIICPDFWKLEKVDNYTKKEIINNNIFNTERNIIPEINSEANVKLQYSCVYDKNVYGPTQYYNDMKNEITITGNDKYIPGFKIQDNANIYINNKNANRVNTIEPDYIVKNQDVNSPYYQSLRKYAMFSGAYSSNNANIVNRESSNILRVLNNLPYEDSNKEMLWKDYDRGSPLICNIVYPQVLGVLDSTTNEKNEVSCEYAKQCGISWSSLKCK